MTIRPVVDLEWCTIGLPSVLEANLRSAFKGLDVDLDACAHVTANESLAKSMRMSGLRAISAVELIDVLVWDAMPDNLRIAIDSYPFLVRDEEAPKKRDDPIAIPLKDWRQGITGKRIGTSLRVDNVIRTYLREVAADEESANLLRRSVRDFRASLEFLSAANFRPDDFVADERLLRLALDTWRHVESEVPTFTNVRRDLWDHHGVIADPQDVPSRDVRRRLDEILRHVFRSDGNRLQVLLHGFFFYTPQQWALFQLLKSHPQTAMCFVVHDDGRDRAFETWRHYFVERWGMPTPHYLPTHFEPVRSSALSSSLEGRRVDPSTFAANTRIVRFANATEFVRDWRLQTSAIVRDELKPLLYAPVPDDVERIVERLSSDSTGTSVNLANLPIGQFLLAAHDSVEFAGRSTLECTLTGQRLIDMSASAFLDSDSEGFHPSRHVPAIRRALPFFEGLRRADDWLTRAAALETLVLGEVTELGEREEGLSDADRMRVAVENELRLVPWCDLTHEEVRTVRFAVEAAKTVVNEIAGEGLRRTDNYLAWIRKRLERALANLDPEGRSEIERKLHGVDVGMKGVLDPDGIRDLVNLILNREIATGPTDDDRTGKGVKDVRSLDALGFHRSTVDVHVANLAETVFPARVSPYGWPFSEGALRAFDHRSVSTEILATRAATAPLGDLYLLRLALDGVGPSSTLTLSWIGEARDDYHNPSTLLNLVREPEVRSAEVKSLVGGLALSPANRGAPSGGSRSLPPTREFDAVGAETATATAAAMIPPAVKGSALICSRRFVLQWALGPSGSFQSAHHHSMLYGNVLGAMSHRRRLGPMGKAGNEARKRLVDDLWQQLTPGQRESSSRKRRVLDVVARSARWEWIFTLGGKRLNAQKPQDKYSGTDRAYQVSRGEYEMEPHVLVGASDATVLPDRDLKVTEAVCNMCPVAPRCAVRNFGET